MSKKTITSDFFTTINGIIALSTLPNLTYRLPFLRKWNSIDKMEAELRNYLKTPDSEVISFYRWSEAIYHALQLLSLKKNDEIIIQWYTCVVVSNAAKQTWSKLIYSDIEESTLGYDLDSLRSSITKKTKVIIVQHTFGKPVDMRAIMEISKERWIIVIEDCALSLGTTIWEQHTWTFGDFSIFSTWRDKVISSVTGWFLVVNNPEYKRKAKNIRLLLTQPSRTLTLRNLFYNIIAFIVYKTYDFIKLGRVIMYVSRKCKLITDILSKAEKKCDSNKFGTSYPNALAYLWRKELKKLDSYNAHRRKISDIYDNAIKTSFWVWVFQKVGNESLNNFRYPFLLITPDVQKEFVKYMRNNNILVWLSWSGSNIAPKGIRIKNTWYIPGSCPVAEDIANRIVMLPNHIRITESEAMQISEIVNNFKNTDV